LGHRNTFGQPGGRNEPERRGERRLITGRYGAIGAWGMINSERSCLPLASRLVAATTDRNAKSMTRRKPIGWFDEELRLLGWTEKKLEQRPKGDKQKVETARMLRQQTTMTLKWIA